MNVTWHGRFLIYFIFSVLKVFLANDIFWQVDFVLCGVIEFIQTSNNITNIVLLEREFQIFTEVLHQY